MKPWNKYNQCMAIAARCSQIFCKLFNIQVSNYKMSLRIELYPINGTTYNNVINMVCGKDSNTLEVFLNFKRSFTDEQLNNIAYNLGVGIADRFFVYREDECGIIGFMLNEFSEYPLYEDNYTFMNGNNQATTIKSDFPLIHYLQTELEVGTLLYHETKDILRPNVPIIKNGSPMFDIQKFTQQQSTLIITIAKNDNSINIELNNHNFTENALNIFKGMSLLTALPFYGIKENKDKGIARIYLTGSNIGEINNIVSINRFSNSDLSKQDIETAIPIIERKLGFNSSFDWEEYLPI